jgi:O-acetylhomoserine/O-acetylserine sulfhydrylase-like pyridoxal-dependent enzyme
MLCSSHLLFAARFNFLPNATNLMTLSHNCKDAGDAVCTHTMYGETEEELLQNAKKHGIEVHGYTEESWNEEIAKNSDHFRKLIKTS